MKHKNHKRKYNLTPFQRAELALVYKGLFVAKAKENQLSTLKQNTVCQNSDKRIIEPVDTRQELSKLADVSHDTIYKVENIKAKAKEKEFERKTTCQKSDKSKLPAIDTKKEISKLADVSHDTIYKVENIKAKAKENLSLTGGDKKSGLQKSAKPINEPVDTRQELSKLADVSHDTIYKVENIKAKAKENLRTHTNEGYKQPLQNSVKAAIDTRQELSKLADVKAKENLSLGGIYKNELPKISCEAKNLEQKEAEAIQTARKLKNLKISYHNHIISY